LWILVTFEIFNENNVRCFLNLKNYGKCGKFVDTHTYMSPPIFVILCELGWGVFLVNFMNICEFVWIEIEILTFLKKKLNIQKDSNKLKGLKFVQLFLINV
jgi:hypothetical protein